MRDDAEMKIFKTVSFVLQSAVIDELRVRAVLCTYVNCLLPHSFVKESYTRCRTAAGSSSGRFAFSSGVLF